MEDEELAQVKKRFVLATKELDRLCKGGKWTMKIPAQESDSDLVLSRSLRDIPDLIEAIEDLDLGSLALVRIVEGLQKQLDNASDLIQDVKDHHREVQNKLLMVAEDGLDRILAVRALHTPLKPDSEGEWYLYLLSRNPMCGECQQLYPCPTITALGGGQ